MVSGDLLETIRKPCFSTKFPQQEIRWNYSIFRSFNLSSAVHKCTKVSFKFTEKQHMHNTFTVIETER